MCNYIKLGDLKSRFLLKAEKPAYTRRRLPAAFVKPLFVRRDSDAFCPESDSGDDLSGGRDVACRPLGGGAVRKCGYRTSRSGSAAFSRADTRPSDAGKPVAAPYRSPNALCRED